MTKELFIDSLRRALYGKIDDRTLADHMRYYENYILQEIASGRSEQEVLEELGDPRLIAKTILDTANAGSSYKEYTVSDDLASERESGVKIHQMQGWKAILIIAVIVIVILLLLTFVFRMVIALLPLLLVIGAVSWIAKKLWS